MTNTDQSQDMIYEVRWWSVGLEGCDTRVSVCRCDMAIICTTPTKLGQLDGASGFGRLLRRPRRCFQFHRQWPEMKCIDFWLQLNDGAARAEILGWWSNFDSNSQYSLLALQ